MGIFGFSRKKKKPEPAVLDCKLGRFVLDRPGRSRFFDGSVDWCGKECGALAYVDDDDPLNVSASLAHLEAVLASSGEWDRRIKEYVADEYSDGGTVEIWGGCQPSEDEELTITRQEFISRMSIGFIAVYPDGLVNFSYELDDMFTDHAMMITAVASGEITGASLWG